MKPGSNQQTKTETKKLGFNTSSITLHDAAIAFLPSTHANSSRRNSLTEQEIMPWPVKLQTPTKTK